VGSATGLNVGDSSGPFVGSAKGLEVGLLVGNDIGLYVGLATGVSVGPIVGDVGGLFVGSVVIFEVGLVVCKMAQKKKTNHMFRGTSRLYKVVPDAGVPQV